MCRSATSTQPARRCNGVSNDQRVKSANERRRRARIALQHASTEEARAKAEARVAKAESNFETVHASVMAERLAASQPVSGRPHNDAVARARAEAHIATLDDAANEDGGRSVSLLPSDAAQFRKDFTRAVAQRDDVKTDWGWPDEAAVDLLRGATSLADVEAIRDLYYSGAAPTEKRRVFTDDEMTARFDEASARFADKD